MGNLAIKQEKFCALGIGDCGTSSFSKYSSFNQDVTNILVQNIQRCGTQVSQSQTIDVSGSYNVLSNITMKQAIQFQVNCPQIANNLADIQNQIVARIQQQADATGQIIALSSTSSSSESSLTNQVQKNINMASINEIMTTVNMQQGIDVSGSHNIIEDVTMDQTSGMIAEASQKVLSQIDAFSQLDSQGDQSSKAETKNPLSFLTDWLGSMGGVVIIGLIVAAYFGYTVFLGGGESNYSQMPYPPQMPQMPQMMYPPPGYLPPGYPPQAQQAQQALQAALPAAAEPVPTK